jgi:P-type conjugative transfer protein TrbJ
MVYVKRTVLFCSLLAAFHAPAFAGGGGGFSGATEVTQMMNNAELAIQTAQDAQALATQINQLNEMLKHGISVNSVWSDANSLLTRLRSSVQQGQAISYASTNVANDFTARYPGYRAPTNYTQQYQQWSDGTLDSIKGSMLAANLQADDLATEDGFHQQLQTLSASASGRMQAIQAGNMIAMENVKQQQKLRSLVMAQMQSQNNYMAAQTQQQAADRANAEAKIQFGLEEVRARRAANAYKKF